MKIGERERGGGRGGESSGETEERMKGGETREGKTNSRGGHRWEDDRETEREKTTIKERGAGGGGVGEARGGGGGWEVAPRSFLSAALI